MVAYKFNGETLCKRDIDGNLIPVTVEELPEGFNAGMQVEGPTHSEGFIFSKDVSRQEFLEALSKHFLKFHIGRKN